MDIFNQFELANHYYDLTNYIDNNIYKFKRNGKYLQENWAMVAGIVAGIGLLGWLITWLINKNKKGKKDNKKTIAEIKQKQNELKQAKEKEKIEYEKASEEEKIEKEAKALAYECASSDPEAVLQISSGNSNSTGGGASSTSAPAASPTPQTSSQSQSMPIKQQPVQQTPSITPKADSQNTILKQFSQNTIPNMIGKNIGKNTSTIVSETLNNITKKQSIGTTLSAFLTRSKDYQQKVIEKTSKILESKDSDINKIAKKTQQLNEENKKINQSTDNVDKLVNKAINTSVQAELKIQSYIQKYDLNSIVLLDESYESMDFNKTINQCRVNPNNYTSDFLIDKLENFNSSMETFYNKFIKIYYGFLNFYHDILELYKEKNPNDEELYILSFTICYQHAVNLFRYYCFSFNNNFDDSKLKANLTSLHNDILDKLKSKNKTYNLSNDIFGFFFAENTTNNISDEMVRSEISKIQKLYEKMKTDNSSDGIYQKINDLMQYIVNIIVNVIFSTETYKNNISQYIEIENKKYNNQLEIVNSLLEKRDESIAKSNNFDSLKVLQYFVYKFLAFLANVFGNVYEWAVDPNVKADNNVIHTIDVSRVNKNMFLNKLKSFFDRSDLTYDTIVSTDKFGIKPFINDFNGLLNTYYKYDKNIEVSKLIDDSMEYRFGYEYWDDDEEEGDKWEQSTITKHQYNPSLYDVIMRDEFLKHIIDKDLVKFPSETASYYYFKNTAIETGKTLAKANNEQFTKYDLFNTEELKKRSDEISNRADSILPASNLRNIESELNKEEEKLKSNPNYNYLTAKNNSK